MRLFVRTYVAASAGLLVLSWVTGPDLRLGGLPWGLACALAAVAIAVGMRAYRPLERRFWQALLLTEVAWSAAAWVGVVGGPMTPAASFDLAAVMFIPGYAAFAWGVLVFLRRMGARRPAAIDAAVATGITALALWPIVAHSVDDLGGRALIGASFPTWDLLFMLLLLRLAFSGWIRKLSLKLLVAGTFQLFVADLLYFSGALQDVASPSVASVMSVAYTAPYLLLGSAALVPSMRTVPPRTPFVEDGRAGRRRTLVVLTLALLATPAAFLADALRRRQYDELALPGIGALIVVLVAYRIALLLRRTEELRAAAAESEEKLRMIFDSAPIGICMGAGGMLTHTNRAMQEMLGYSADELARMHYLDITHPEDTALAADPTAGVTASYEKRCVGRTGETIWTNTTLTRATDDRFSIAVVEDITVAKQLEDDLRHAQKMEAVGQLAGGVAHDFNNLMTAAGGYAALLQRDLHPADPRREMVDAIATATDRATELTRKLLAFSRRQTLRVVPTDVAAVVREFEPILRRLLPESISISSALADAAIARADAAQLEQVLLNLALNARDAMPGGGVLHIGVGVALDAVVLTVRDDGIGMSDETRQRIFEPFFTTKPVGQGTGLGLATVDGIVGQLGGTLEVESAAGLGTTFTIRLPLELEVLLAPEAEPEAEQQEPAAGTVLLVEDEELVRLVTSEMLRVSGYGVDAAASAEDALALLEDGLRPDVLVSDVVMTGVDGPTLVDRARAIVPEIPVLFVSGYPAETLRDRTSEAILTKPFTPAELAARIEEVRRAVVPA